jgi:hypothetical protein
MLLEGNFVFQEMLKEKAVTPFSKWEKELPKITRFGTHLNIDAFQCMEHQLWFLDFQVLERIYCDP